MNLDEQAQDIKQRLLLTKLGSEREWTWLCEIVRLRNKKVETQNKGILEPIK